MRACMTHFTPFLSPLIASIFTNITFPPQLSLIPRHQIFCERLAALSKNSLVKLGRNHMSVSACRTNQIA